MSEAGIGTVMRRNEGKRTGSLIAAPRGNVKVEVFVGKHL